MMLMGIVAISSAWTAISLRKFAVVLSHGNRGGVVTTIVKGVRRLQQRALQALALTAVCGAATGVTVAPTETDALAAHPLPTTPAGCLASGDGYLRAHLAGAIDAKIDWPNSGTHCEGEYRDKPPGIRLSFQRAAGGTPNLLLVFGLTGVRAGKPAHAVGANLTVIVQGKSRIYGTLGDTRCTVDSLTQRPVTAGSSAAGGTKTGVSAGAGTYRVEARGFCTQPAHAIRGEGDVLVSTFEFAGLVNYQVPEK